MSETKWVYRFDEVEAAEASAGDWDSVRGLLGGKGANLGDMTRLGVPVPPGFTVSTEACLAYLDADEEFPAGAWEQIEAALASIESSSGKKFGDATDPLLLSVRSGAKFSMPGMMDTVLNLGLNDEVVEGMVALTGDEHFVYDSYRRLIQMFGSVVLGLRDELFEHVSRASTRAERCRDRCRADGRGPSRRSSTSSRASRCASPTSRSSSFASPPRPSSSRGTASAPSTIATPPASTTASAPPSTSRPWSSATWAMTRRPGSRCRATPPPVRTKSRATSSCNAQGEDVVAGIRPTKRMAAMADEMPEIYEEFAGYARSLESHYREMQDMEFTVERGKLWVLQTRDGKRTAQAAVRIAVNLAEEGLIDRTEAVMRVQPDQVDFFLHPQFSPEAKEAAQFLASGLNVSPGAAVGVIAFDADLAEEWAADREVIMVRPETKPEDVHGMLAANGILTSRGGRTSHAALVARQFGKPAVVGVTELQIDLQARTMDRGRRRSGGRATGSPSTAPPATSTSASSTLSFPISRTPTSRDCSSGQTSCVTWTCAPMPTTRPTPNGPGPMAPRASGSPAPSTCSLRASGCRLCRR